MNDISTGQNMASAPVGSASVIQQHGHISMEHRRALTQVRSIEDKKSTVQFNCHYIMLEQICLIGVPQEIGMNRLIARKCIYFCVLFSYL